MNAYVRASDPGVKLASFPVLMVALVGCTSSTTTVSRRVGTPSEVPMRHETSEPAGVPVAEERPAEIGLDTLGFAARPNVFRAARTANRKALTHHRKGDYEASRKGFEAALAVSPGHDMARFNLACALSRLGEVEKARDHMRVLLYRDLIRFQGRWQGPDADADLQQLRESSFATELDELIGNLRVAYNRALDEGIPAYLYDSKPYEFRTNDQDDNYVVGGTSHLIAGVWLQAAGRFVPLAHGHNAALIDLKRRKVALVSAGLEVGHCVTVSAAPTIEWVSVDPDPEQQTSATAQLKSSMFDDWGDIPVRGDYSVGRVGDALGIEMTWADDTFYFTLDAPEGLKRRSARVVFDDVWLELVPEGARFHVLPPEGYRISRRSLTVPGRDESISLDRSYDHVFATSDAAAPVFVLGRIYEAGTEEDHWTGRSEAIISRVDVVSGKSETLVRGKGPGWVVVGTDGAVYIEVGEQTQRWATADAAAPEPTMDGLHISMTLELPFCGCCG